MTNDTIDYLFPGEHNRHSRNYDVPVKLTQLEGVKNLSFGNDSCPHWGVEWRDGALDLWVETIDPATRESGGARFTVLGSAWSDEFADVLDRLSIGNGQDPPPSPAPPGWAFETDDIDDAIKVLVTWTAQIHKETRP